MVIEIMRIIARWTDIGDNEADVPYQMGDEDPSLVEYYLQRYEAHMAKNPYDGCWTGEQLRAMCNDPANSLLGSCPRAPLIQEGTVVHIVSDQALGWGWNNNSLTTHFHDAKYRNVVRYACQ